MKSPAAPLERVINELSKLPSIGRKTAQRLAFHLLKAPIEDANALARSIEELRQKIRFCRDCFNLAEEDLCPVCTDPKRDRTSLCVVEEPTDLLSVEATSAFRGLYHVLGGALSPLGDVGPDQLNIRPLMQRLGEAEFAEVILATNPNVEGEATAVYLSRLLKPLGLRVTRLAQGLPAGGDLEFTDELTLRRALEGRRQY
ncbi:MAG: recombination protein RecR [bacterium]|nr:recombination protein RecR [bacterium]